MISVFLYLDFSDDHLSQNPDNRETGYSNVLDKDPLNHQMFVKVGQYQAMIIIRCIYKEVVIISHQMNNNKEVVMIRCKRGGELINTKSGLAAALQNLHPSYNRLATAATTG